MKNEQTVAGASATGGWRKSSYSGGGNGNCIEVNDAASAGVPVRDSKQPQGPVLVFGERSWAAFVAHVR